MAVSRRSLMDRTITVPAWGGLHVVLYPEHELLSRHRPCGVFLDGVTGLSHTCPKGKEESDANRNG